MLYWRNSPPLKHLRMSSAPAELASVIPVKLAARSLQESTVVAQNLMLSVARTESTAALRGIRVVWAQESV